MLEIPEVRASVSPISVEQYHLFPEFNENGRRTELVRGIVIEKTSKSPLHASIAKLLYDKFHAALPPEFSVRQDQPLTLDHSEPESDIAVVRGSVDDYRQSHPRTAELVIEIAISSVNLDRQKVAVYAEAMVQEYWIILPSERKVEMYRHPENGRYLDCRVAEGGDMIACATLAALRVSLAELWA
jgi:Uma2 family endonuclease